MEKIIVHLALILIFVIALASFLLRCFAPQYLSQSTRVHLTKTLSVHISLGRILLVALLIVVVFVVIFVQIVQKPS